MSTTARTLVGGGRDFVIISRKGLFPNHGYKARAEFEAGSCDWLRRLGWLYELALGSRKVLDRKVFHGKRKEKVKERIHGQTRFEDNYSNCSPPTAPEMLVGNS